MIPPWSLSAAFRLVLILLAISLSGVVASNPWTHDQEVIANGQQHMKACVFGSPKMYDQWTIHYHEVKPSSQFLGQFILDPAWVARHQTVGDTDVRAASFMILKEMPSSNIPSVSPWVPPGSHGPRIGARFVLELTSKISIQPENIIPRPRDGPDQITHAYNRLCHNEAGI
ncbi:hypothetical protein ACSS6W_009711 [Trichoderma asperelloides]